MGLVSVSVPMKRGSEEESAVGVMGVVVVWWWWHRQARLFETPSAASPGGAGCLVTLNCGPLLLSTLNSPTGIEFNEAPRLPTRTTTHLTHSPIPCIFPPPDTASMLTINTALSTSTILSASALCNVDMLRTAPHRVPE